MGRVLAAVGVAALIAALPTGAAEAATATTHWRAVQRDSAAAMWASGSYLYSETSEPWNGELLDVRTGKPVYVRAPRACQPVAIGGPWMLFSCWAGPPVELYQLAPPHSWRQPADGAALDETCAEMQASCVPVAVGSDWIEYDAEVCPLGEHCAYTPEFQSIATGAEQADPATPGGRTYADLGSVSLSRRLCRPLHTPTSSQDFGPPQPGDVDFFGEFALMSAVDSLDGSGKTSLERCGSSRVQTLDTFDYTQESLGADNDAIVWLHGPGHVDGVALPQDRRFTIAIPGIARPNGQYPTDNLAISGRRVFVIREGVIWSTTLPALSPAG